MIRILIQMIVKAVDKGHHTITTYARNYFFYITIYTHLPLRIPSALLPTHKVILKSVDGVDGQISSGNDSLGITAPQTVGLQHVGGVARGWSLGRGEGGEEVKEEEHLELKLSCWR